MICFLQLTIDAARVSFTSKFLFPACLTGGSNALTWHPVFATFRSWLRYRARPRRSLSYTYLDNEPLRATAYAPFEFDFAAAAQKKSHA
uniref:Uncharacterized protein n=1 Tax=Rhipicephalus pulchellus TaxID=72859 RepID=L7LXR5_RHIPC